MRLRPSPDEWRIERARRKARRLHHECGVDAPGHIRLWEICKKLGVKVDVVPLKGVDAQFIRWGTRATILLSDRIKDPRKRLFDAAHELGHCVLGHPMLLARKHNAAGDRVSIYEREASAFASELLMPERLVRRSHDLTRLALTAPRQISDDYGVSILASAIRVAELASEPCAAVFSVANDNGFTVDWVRASATFEHAIRVGQPISPESLANSLFTRREPEETSDFVHPLAWFGTRSSLRLIEHSIFSRQYNTVLSMLWVVRGIA